MAPRTINVRLHHSFIYQPHGGTTDLIPAGIATGHKQPLYVVLLLMDTYNRGGGQVKFYPYKKSGAEQVLAILKGGGGPHNFEVVLTWELKILAIVMGWGHRQVLPCLEGWGGGQKVSDPRCFHFVAPPPPPPPRN